MLVDEEPDIERLQRQQEEKIHTTASRYHKAFVQCEDGAKLLEGWINHYCIGRPPLPSASARECGIADGKRELIREIIEQIQIAGGSNNE